MENLFERWHKLPLTTKILFPYRLIIFVLLIFPLLYIIWFLILITLGYKEAKRFQRDSIF
jgi:hypothetical protein